MLTPLAWFSTLFEKLKVKSYKLQLWSTIFKPKNDHRLQRYLKASLLYTPYYVPFYTSFQTKNEFNSASTTQDLNTLPFSRQKGFI